MSGPKAWVFRRLPDRSAIRAVKLSATGSAQNAGAPN